MSLIMFFGTECEHCAKMEKLVQKLEKEIGVSVIRLEVWHDKENRKTMEELDIEPCDGVPFFLNQETEKTLCGEGTYDELKTWAGK